MASIDRDSPALDGAFSDDLYADSLIGYNTQRRWTQGTLFK